MALQFESSTMIWQGELIVSSGDCSVQTVLGSCVAVTMYHHRTHTGAMCHAMLPESSLGNVVKKPFNPFLYVDTVMAIMFKRFATMGIDISDLEIKYFGGSDMFPASIKQYQGIGQKNIEAVKTVLRAYNVRADVYETGGNLGRKIIFDLSNGDVYVRKVKSQQEAIGEVI